MVSGGKTSWGTIKYSSSSKNLLCVFLSFRSCLSYLTCSLSPFLPWTKMPLVSIFWEEENGQMIGSDVLYVSSRWSIVMKGRRSCWCVSLLDKEMVAVNQKSIKKDPQTGPLMSSLRKIHHPLHDESTFILHSLWSWSWSLMVPK